MKASNVVQWRTSPKQSFFLSRDEDELMYGGRPGGGKTVALLLHNIIRREKYPGSAGLYLRRQRDDLKKAESAIPLSHQLLSGVAAWNGTDLKWTFPNGSVLEFGGCKDEDDKYNYKSGGWIDIQFDELTQFTKTQYEFIAFSRARARAGQGIKIQIRAGTNPGDIGNKWVYDRFLVPAKPYESYTYDTRLEDGSTVTRSRMFIPSSFWDNPFIDRRQYAASLAQITDPAEAKAMAGRWDIFEGQVFTEWDPRMGRHIIPPFAIPQDWPRWSSTDYGYDAPWATHWYTQNLDLWAAYKIPRYYCYREVYQRKVPAHIQPLVMKKLEAGDRIRGRVADASMWQGYEAGTSLIRYYEKVFGRGMIRKSMPKGSPMKTRVGTKSHVHWLLGDADDGLPRMQFFTCCPHMIRTLPMLQYDKHKTDDVDTDGEDHGYDDLRYWASMIVAAIERAKPQKYRIAA